jgi:hypothetical protein
MAEMDIEVAALAATLRTTQGCDDGRDRSRALSFWTRSPQRESQPQSTRYAEEYDGSTTLSLSVALPDLSPSQQKQRLAEWCLKLQSFDKVEWVWLYGNVPQVLFDAVCQMSGLKGLSIERSRISTLAALSSAHQLHYLKLGNSPGILDLEPLAGLTALKWLQLDNLKAITSLEPLQGLIQLEGLGFTGSDHKSHLIDSLTPLSRLIQLRWLHLGALRVQDESLQPLAGLKQLTWLGLPNCFSVEAFAALSDDLSPDICDWLQPYARFHSSVLPCRVCQQNWRVMCAGLGSKALCPTCDAVKLAQHILRFNRAKQAARTE